MAASTLEKIKPTTMVSSSVSPLDRAYRITLDRYSRMVETGVFDSNDPIYLWKGVLVEKTTKYQPHNIAASELNVRLVQLIPAGWFLRSEQPIALDNGSVPEPDFAIVRGKSRDFPRFPPQANEVSLLIEIAESSLAQDQGEVLRAYAENKIPVYWIVNIPQRRIEEYKKPSGKGEKAKYREIRVFKEEENVPIVLDGREIGVIKVSDLLI
ncbi:MAG: Uma2 family endonuclease [Isosphaeraceae bacterium]